MRIRSTGVLLLCALILAPFASFTSFAANGATTAPSSTRPATSAPSTASASPSQPDANPGALPSTQQAAAPHFPTPQEIAAKWLSGQKEQDALTKVAYFDLSGKITEKAQGSILFAPPDASTTL